MAGDERQPQVETTGVAPGGVTEAVADGVADGAANDAAGKGAPALTADERVAVLEERLARLEARQPEDRVSLVVFSGDLDRVLAGLVIATGAAAMGQQVSMFFTFWGLSALKEQRQLAGKGLAQRLMALMTPASTQGMGVSQMNFFGVGARMLRSMMAARQVSSPEDLMQLAQEMGVRMVACEMSRDVMGIQPDELREDAEAGGVATFLGDALQSRVTLFV